MTRDNHRVQFAAAHRAIEKRYVGQIYIEVRRQYKSFLAAAKTHGFDYARHHIDTIVEVSGIVKVLKRMYRTAAYVESNRVLSSLIKAGFRVKRIGAGPVLSVGFDEIAQTVDDYFKIYLLNNSAIPITETTKKYIRDHLIAQVDAGVPYEDAVANFTELALSGGPNQSSMSKTRAAMIAQTEATRSLSFGGLIGAYMSGVDVDKEWITSEDERVRGETRYARYPHTVLDRQVTSLFGAFSNGERIKFPGDPEASKANTINCRCSNFYKEKQRPQPRVSGRSILNFLTDFFTGFLISQAVTQEVQATTTEDDG